MKVVVDFDACQGNANCMVAAPEVFQVTNEGLLVVLNENPNIELRDKVEAAARVCPTQAITIEA